MRVRLLMRDGSARYVDVDAVDVLEAVLELENAAAVGLGWVAVEWAEGDGVSMVRWCDVREVG